MPIFQIILKNDKNLLKAKVTLKQGNYFQLKQSVGKLLFKHALNKNTLTKLGISYSSQQLLRQNHTAVGL